MTNTVQDIITDALLDIKVSQMGTAPAAKLTDHALRHLTRILRAWQANADAPAFRKASQVLTLTTASSYTLNPERPVRILSARFKRGTVETPMMQITRDEYDTIPIKTTTGTPTQFYYDRQKEDALFYIWPVLSVAAGETIQITHERAFTTPAIGDEIDLPPEWWDAAVKALAARLAPAYGKESLVPGLQALADRALASALGAEAEGESVYFVRGHA